MDSRSLYFSPTLIPLKIYSIVAFFRTASTATTTKEHFKIHRMLWMTVYLHPGGDDEGEAVARRWGVTSREQDAGRRHVNVNIVLS
jgi:hypothetical protein